jgi:hypothetical protein
VKIQSNYVLINTKKKSTADSENKLPDIVRKADHLRTPISNPTLAKRTVPTRPVVSVKSSEKQRPATGTETATTTTPVASTTATTVDVTADGGETGSAVLAAAGTPEDAVERDADEEVYCDATPDYNLLRNGLGSTGIHSICTVVPTLCTFCSRKQRCCYKTVVREKHRHTKTEFQFTSFPFIKKQYHSEPHKKHFILTVFIIYRRSLVKQDPYVEFVEFSKFGFLLAHTFQSSPLCSSTHTTDCSTFASQ